MEKNALIERPPSLKENGAHNVLYPAEVKGRYRRIRDILHFILLLVFLIMPWVEVGGYQSLLFDIPNRRFAIFGITFWAHDTPMLFFVLITLALGLAFVTALFGRVWCGWACPQVVFVESVFRKVEYWIQGDSIARKKLAKGPWTTERIVKHSIKWLAFLFLSFWIAHSFLAYFIGADRLAVMSVSHPQENMTIFLLMLFITGLVLFDFGWFREQFCLIMCPYGRIQSLLMDEDSVTVVYDETRHEDCVNCFKCVRSCPTGIDIRDGMQMECVACTSCIDACDTIMRRIDKPEGLVRYDSLNALKGQKLRWFRVRTLIYLVLILLSVFGLTYALKNRELIDVTFVRAVGVPYTVLTMGESGPTQIMNQFKGTFHNHSFDKQHVVLSLSEEMKQKGFELITAAKEFDLETGKTQTIPLFIKGPQKMFQLEGSVEAEVKVKLKSERGDEEIVKDLKIVGSTK